MEVPDNGYPLEKGGAGGGVCHHLKGGERKCLILGKAVKGLTKRNRCPRGGGKGGGAVVAFNCEKKI